MCQLGTPRLWEGWEVGVPTTTTPLLLSQSHRPSVLCVHVPVCRGSSLAEAPTVPGNQENGDPRRAARCSVVWVSVGGCPPLCSRRPEPLPLLQEVGACKGTQALPGAWTTPPCQPVRPDSTFYHPSDSQCPSLEAVSKWSLAPGEDKGLSSPCPPSVCVWYRSVMLAEQSKEA